MKKYIVSLIFWGLMFSVADAQTQFPIHLAGYTLGKDISTYKETINFETCRETISNPFIGEGKIIPSTGFKSGIIAYGLCDNPNKIFRIKVKYADSSRHFFDTLLEKYKENLGPPDEYKGDSFQTVIAWKWSFTNKKNETISLILQHNTMVEDEKKGNAAKLTLTSQFRKERECYQDKQPDKNKVEPKKTEHKKLWKSYIPY